MNYDRTKFKVWTWKHPVMLHWIINPGLAINELFLGQRVPKIMLIEKDPGKSLAEKTFIPCPHCHTLHSSLKWSLENKTAFGNWFGLYCDHCGNIIPCLRNLVSFLLLCATFPIWAWFKKDWKDDWLARQKVRFSKLPDLVPPSINWISQGLGFGFLMFMTMGIIIPLIENGTLSAIKLIIDFFWWTFVAGLAWGYMMKRIFRLPGKTRINKSS